MKDNQIGDLTGLLGLAISIVGFIATLYGVMKSKRAAERAEEATKQTKKSIQLFETVVDFAAAIAALEEIRRAHRARQWSMVLDRYALVRKTLVTLRSGGVSLTLAQQAAVQGAITTVQSIERAVERALDSPDSLKPSKLN